MHDNLADAFLDAVRSHGGKACITEGERTWRYEEIGGMACAAASLIAGREPRGGAPIGLLIPNSSLFVTNFFGTLIANRVTMPINPLLKGEEIAAQIVHSGARLILTVTQFGALIDATRKALGNEHEIEVVYCDTLPQADPDETGAAFDGISTERNKRPDRDPDTVAILLYTSGSTGVPKGVMLTHKNILSNVHATHTGLGVREDDVFLAVLPYFHIFGLTCCLAVPILKGNRFVVVPRFSVDETVRAIRDGGVTLLLMVPTMYFLITKSRRATREDFETVRFGISGGSPLSTPVAEAFTQKYGVEVGEGYGATEVSPVVAMSNIGATRRGSVGPLVQDVEVRIVDPEGQALAAGERGRILVRGPNVMKGYWRRPDLTAEVLDAEGWYNTRDMGWLDEDNFLYIAGRTDDMILMGAENIYPIDIERVLAEHPAVAEVAVAGIADEMRGQVISAFVRPREDETLLAADLKIFCAKRLSPVKIPGKFHLVTDFPRTSTGKIQKFRLADEYEGFLVEEKAE